MCESNKKNEGSDGKSPLLTPLLSQGPKGVSKIFILTPEILKTLGLTGHQGIRKASRDEPKSINISTLNLQQSPRVADHESNSTSVKIVPEATSSTSEVKKRQRDSISDKNADETPETPKSAIENSTQLEQRLNGINKKISNHPNNEKGSISCTLKTKKIRRRSSAVDNQREESTNKQAGNESKNESEPVVSGVRSSKRPAKPKKFDDYVMTDVFSNKSRTSDDIDDTPISAKRQSRKSSGNSSKAGRPNSREKAATEKIDKVEETKSDKAPKAMDQRSSTTRKSLSNDEICSTVSETKICVDKSKVVKTYESRNSRDQKPLELVSNDELISKKEAEPFGQESSGTITGPADKKIFLPVQPGKMNVSNVKIIKIYQKPKIKDKIAPESVELGDKAESKRSKSEPATSVQEISKSENISSTRKICAKKPEKQINVKAVKSYEKPKAKENIGGDIVQPEETKKSIEKDERTSSMSSGSETQIIVSSTKIRTIETLESQCFEKPREMESQIHSPKSPMKNEEFKAPEPKLTKLRLKGRLITISKSKLRKFSGPLSVSKPLPPIFQDKNDPSIAKSHLPRSPDKKEEAGFSKTIVPSFQDKKEIGTLQTDPTMTREDKKEASISAPIPSKVLIKKQAGGSNMIMPISRNDNKETSIPKTISPGCLTKKEIVSNPNITKSANETAASCSKPDKPKFLIKKRISAAKPNIPKYLNKKEVVASTAEVPISVDKEEIKASKQKSPICADNKGIKSSIVEVSISPDLKEVGAPIPEVPKCPVHKKYRSSVPEVPISPDKIGTNAAILEVPMLLDVKQTGALLPEVSTSRDKNKTDASIWEVSTSSVNIEVTTSKSKLPISPAKKDISSSIPEVPIFVVEKDVMISKSAVLTSPGKKEATTSILEAPISSDKEAQDNIPNLVGNDAMNATDILNVDSSTEIPLSSPTSSNVEQEIVLKNFSITGDYIVEELDGENKIPLEETPDEVSEHRVPRKMGKRRSRKPRISFEAPEDQGTNIKVENTVSIAGSSFDTFAESTCRTKKSTQKSKDDTDAKDLNDAESKQHEILFRCSEREDKDSVSNTFDDTDNPSSHLGSNSSTKVQPMSSPNLVVEEEIVVENFPTGKESVTEAMEAENCIPVEDFPKKVSKLRLQRKKGKSGSIKPQISVEAPEDQVTNIEVENTVPIAGSSFDTFAESTCRTKKSMQKSKDDTDAKDLNDAESKQHEILFSCLEREDKDSIPNTIDDADNPSSHLGSNSSTKVQPMSSSNLVVEEEIVVKNFPTGDESVTEAMEAENCIPVEDFPKKVSKLRLQRKKGKSGSIKPQISVEAPEDQVTNIEVENTVPIAGRSFDTFAESTCRTKKSTQKSKDDTDAKDLNDAESKQHEILFNCLEREDKDSIPNTIDDADNPSSHLGSNSSTKVQPMSSPNLVVEEEIVVKNFPTGEESVTEAMEAENYIPVEDFPKKVSKLRLQRKKGKSGSIKPQISVEAPEDQVTNVEVEIEVPTAASSFDAFVESTGQTKKPTQKSKDADAKDPNEAQSKKHKILFKSPDKENQDSIPNTFDDADKFTNILDSNPSTEVEPISSSTLDVEEEIVLKNFPIEEVSAIQVTEAENCIPLQRAPKTKSVVRVPRKKGRPRKPPIAIERLDDEETDQQVENVISTAPNSFDTFVKGTGRTKKSIKKSGDETDAKNLNEAESEEHEILTKSPDENDEENIPNIFDDADNRPDILDSNPSTEIQAMSQAHLVVEEKIVDENFPTGEKSVVEVMEVKNCIPLQDESKKVSEFRVPRKRGRPRKLPIVVEPPEDKETDQQVENVISITANSFDTFVGGTCRTKKPVQRSKDEIDGKGLSEDSEGEFENDEIVLKRSRGRPGGSIPRGKRGRGRGRGKTRQRVDFEYVPREKSSGTKQSNATESTAADNSEGPNVDDSQSADVECGKCKEKMMKSEWSGHNLSKHNNMGWRNGEEEPDFSDEKFLRSVLMAALKKKNKRNALTCETCGIGKRSANGFISHLQFCGKTEEERQSLLLTCPICGNVMMPSSMEMHQRFHRQMDVAMEEQKKNAPTGTGRGKRKAAEKAATKISEFTDLVKEEEVAPSKKRRREEVMNLIEKPRYLKGTPNRWRGIWKNEINTKGVASCRQPGCKFTEDSIEALCNHNITCPCTPRQNFVCKICKFSSESQKQVVKHVKAKHDGGSTGQQEDSDFEGEDSSSSSDSSSNHSTDVTPPISSVSVKKPAFEKRQRPKTNIKFLDDLSHIDPKWHTSFSPAIRWTMEFECENYRLRLFKDLKPNVMKLLNDEDTLGYLPELSCSMRTKEAKKRTDDKPPEWVSWKRFEGRGAEGIPTFFTGGPVWALAWLPIPAPLYDHSVDQYVAVSTHPTMESVYVVGRAHVGKNLIQIWNLGHLEHNKTTDHVVPTLSYGVAHDKGTIWCLEWCPSGCYEHSSFLDENEVAEENQDRKRMGLLAAACSDGCVHVFSLPFPDRLHFEKSDHANSLPIYETKPILTLIASTAMYEKGEQNWQCTKLNWSKELGHDTIIAGFSNGYVAMWDLNSATPLFVTRRGETTLIDAFHHFYAHGHAISFVQMVPYGGKRFFITSGYDRLSKVWDFEDTSYPLSTTKRGIALDGAWLNHWPGYLTAYDDVMVHGHTYLMSLRQPGLKIFPLLPSNSPTFSVEVSDYGNSIGHGTMAGEVLVMFPHHLWNHRDMDRDVPRKRWLASSSEVVDIAASGSGKEKIINSCLKRKVGKDYVYMPETYDDCRNRFGIIFRDNLNRSKHDGHRKQSRPPCSERMSAVQIEQYPFASANRVSWNPNAWSYLWLCVGYQNGLVRFLNFNSVAVDRELRKLLPSHAKSMLDVSRKSLKFENDPVNSSHTSETRSNS